MRPWLLILVILLSIQLHMVQGIRLRRGADLPNKQLNNIQECLRGKIKNDGVEKANHGGTNHCSGRNRKLTMTPISSSPTIAKNDEENKARSKPVGSLTNQKLGRKEENFSVNPSSVNKQRQPSPGPHPDTLDLAEMDYTLARRKPPIHN